MLRSEYFSLIEDHQLHCWFREPDMEEENE
ncbi:Uncharacterised protein [Mycobacteroides abscessus subsp. abscessus]|nr:Uncharacterised protein [Mycobacteroides abscessus]SHR62273.1 Uncharacterised protein [Mycobacteroides abscessus subsp. abscessus]SKE74492.1 Uncharacterised protein [Mycobacteroides abscessus subsp. bolletii]SHS06342.1 Uncharacterised protein [Mycobacteroides abscessus subsp. abscessus]SHS93671.1 Uncharacterised protein [Mycobacteroides abscessus subsp. abscessus]